MCVCVWGGGGGGDYSCLVPVCGHDQRESPLRQARVPHKFSPDFARVSMVYSYTLTRAVGTYVYCV